MLCTEEELGKTEVVDELDELGTRDELYRNISESLFKKKVSAKTKREQKGEKGKLD